MKWFCGSIAEAISFAQQRKATFVSYVEGKCDSSKLMSSVFEDREICNNLECSRFVCVKIDANDVGYRQLVQIYKNVPVPSLFYISHSGVPLDIVEGVLYDDVSELKEIILESTTKCNQLNSTQGPPPNVPQDKLLEVRRLQIEKILEKKRDERRNSSKPAVNSSKEADDVKVENKKESETNEALKKQDAELKKLVEEREKEKMEEASARQRIREQIAQDRAERAERMKMTTEGSSSSNSETTKSKVTNKSPPSSHARIQFRLPSGESKSDVFPNETKLIQIRDYIDNNFELAYKDYRLATTFPRREFTFDDNESTLELLQLIPTAVILILPNAPRSVDPFKRSWVQFAVNSFYSTFETLLSIPNYIRNFLFGQRDNQPPPAAQGTSSTSSNPQSSNQARQRTHIRKVGNIHSLQDLQDGNDENNTWNGNSTQQM